MSGKQTESVIYQHKGDEYLEHTTDENALNTAKRMLEDGKLTMEKIAEYAGLSLEEVKRL